MSITPAFSPGPWITHGAVVGKQPSLSPRSTARREPLEPAEIGAGTIVSTGAIVFAGSSIGADCAAMLQIAEDAQPVFDDQMRFAALDVGDEADAAGILL